MLLSAAMPKTRLSVTIERELLDELKKLSGNDVKPSELFSEAVRDEIRRLEMLALLDEMDRRDPLTPEDCEAGDRLWEAIESSSIPARFQCSPTRRDRFGGQSAAH